MVFDLSSSSSMNVAVCSNGSNSDSSSGPADNPAGRNSHHGVKPAPKKAHKAEREKLKRDHLNELFYELGNALEPSRQNNGKASILGDATKLLRDLITQVEALRREHSTLLNESRYVTLEKNELKDETVVLGEEIEKLQEQIQERMQQSVPWTDSLTPDPIITQTAATPWVRSLTPNPLITQTATTSMWTGNLTTNPSVTQTATTSPWTSSLTPDRSMTQTAATPWTGSLTPNPLITQTATTSRWTGSPTTNPSMIQTARTSPWTSSRTPDQSITQTATTQLPIQSPLVIAPPMYVAPVLQDQACVEQVTEPATTSEHHNSAYVSRPHARYPSPADSWTFRILPRPTRTGDDNISSMSASSNGEEGRSPPRELNLLN